MAILRARGGNELALAQAISGAIEMHVIRRAAALAYSFVSLNYAQAAAIKYLVRPAGNEGGPDGARDVAVGRASRGGSVVKLGGLFAAMLSVAALSGTPASEAAASAMSGAARTMVNAIWISPGSALDGASVWTESGSLLLLATGFFGAALIVRRRSR